MDTEEMIPVTEDMTVAERRAARKHNRELWRKPHYGEDKKEKQIRVEKDGNTNK